MRCDGTIDLIELVHEIHKLLTRLKPKLLAPKLLAIYNEI